MTVNDNENIAPFDVDGTLILSPSITDPPGSSYVDIFYPATEKYVRQRVNRAMVNILKEEKSRGAYVLVWSRCGKEWAKNTIKALDLEGYVDHIMAKPRAYFDDLPVEQWLKDRVFIEPDVSYKE